MLTRFQPGALSPLSPGGGGTFRNLPGLPNPAAQQTAFDIFRSQITGLPTGGTTNPNTGYGANPNVGFGTREQIERPQQILAGKALRQLDQLVALPFAGDLGIGRTRGID